MIAVEPLALESPLAGRRVRGRGEGTALVDPAFAPVPSVRPIA